MTKRRCDVCGRKITDKSFRIEFTNLRANKDDNRRKIREEYCSDECQVIGIIRRTAEGIWDVYLFGSAVWLDEW